MGKKLLFYFLLVIVGLYLFYLINQINLSPVNLRTDVGDIIPELPFPQNWSECRKGLLCSSCCDEIENICIDRCRGIMGLWKWNVTEAENCANECGVNYEYGTPE